MYNKHQAISYFLPKARMKKPKLKPQNDENSKGFAKGLSPLHGVGHGRSKRKTKQIWRCRQLLNVPKYTMKVFAAAICRSVLNLYALPGEML